MVSALQTHPNLYPLAGDDRRYPDLPFLGVYTFPWFLQWKRPRIFFKSVGLSQFFIKHQGKPWKTGANTKDFWGEAPNTKEKTQQTPRKNTNQEPHKNQGIFNSSFLDLWGINLSQQGKQSGRIDSVCGGLCPQNSAPPVKVQSGGLHTPMQLLCVCAKILYVSYIVCGVVDRGVCLHAETLLIAHVPRSCMCPTLCVELLTEGSVCMLRPFWLHTYVPRSNMCPILCVELLTEGSVCMLRPFWLHLCP